MLFDLQVRGDFKRAERTLGRMGRQIPFATSLAINNVLKLAQRFQQGHMMRRFKVRRAKWVRRAVKIKPFANKRTLFGVIKIDPPGNRDDILTKFERGGTKRPRAGRNLAVPTPDVRRGATGVISRRWRPSGLNFQRTAGGVVRGDRRTFVVKDVGIYQRKGRKGKAIKLYHFVRSVPIEARLDFVRNVVRTVRQKMGKQFERAVRFAFATAKR